MLPVSGSKCFDAENLLQLHGKAGERGEAVARETRLDLRARALGEATNQRCFWHRGTYCTGTVSLAALSGVGTISCRHVLASRLNKSPG